jgi:hypothetical protein
MKPEPIPLIDFEALRRHVADYDSLFVKLLQLFLEQAPLWQGELKEAFASGDALVLRQLCHKIKGGAGTLQATAIIQAVEELRFHAVSGDLTPAEPTRDRLLSVIEQTIDFVRASGYVQT